MSEDRMDLFGDFTYTVSPAGEVVVTSKVSKGVVMRLTPTSAEKHILEMIDLWDTARRVTDANIAARPSEPVEEVKEGGRFKPSGKA
jgi:hypothetical protein